MQLDVGHEPNLSRQRCRDPVVTWCFLEFIFFTYTCSPIDVVYCGKVSGCYFQNLLRYELFSPISVKSRQTTDRNWCIWAHRAIRTSGLKNDDPPLICRLSPGHNIWTVPNKWEKYWWVLDTFFLLWRSMGKCIFLNRSILNRTILVRIQAFSWVKYCSFDKERRTLFLKVLLLRSCIRKTLILLISS